MPFSRAVAGAIDTNSFLEIPDLPETPDIFITALWRSDNDLIEQVRKGIDVVGFGELVDSKTVAETRRLVERLEDEIRRIKELQDLVIQTKGHVRRAMLGSK